jgi:predicted dehydrogenase/threonine dehydrogenase-like Zn-dependent dehydrogenase
MKQVLIKRGQALVEEIPSPKVEAGHVLVETEYSCISIGTEMSGLKEGSKSLLQRAIEHPEQVVLAARMVIDQGIGRTMSVIRGALETGNPTGYSAAGTVREAGEGIKDIQAGDRVACAGAGIANHAEIINVPRNLLVKIPDALGFAEASTVTLGATALQGIRRATPTLGETFLVMGLGILGQLTVQMLKANGCRVAGTDLDASRLDAAKRLGMDFAITPDEDGITRIMQLTDGFGADGVIITAATSSDEVVSQAFRSCRKKGRVVLVGDVGLHLKRGDFYTKEIDFFISTSYGPGRYEPNYEQQGLDYPIGYVRWTENRNMQEYVKLLSEGSINIKPLMQKEYSLDAAPSAYEELKSGKDKPLMVLLRYAKEGSSAKRVSLVGVNPKWPKKEGKLNIAIIGGGDFAKAMHLPNLKKLADHYSIYAVMGRTGTKAKAIAVQYGAAYATTDYHEVLKDRDVDMVMITMRHNLHATLAIDAVRAGKAVFLEKPMALNRKELDVLAQALQDSSVPFLVGFNRRFSPYAKKIQQITDQRTNPMIIDYRMNAGFIPRDHWTQTPEGGGRNLGEACHIYDLFTYFTGSEVISVSATSINPKTEQYLRSDNFTATVKFKDGSVCNLIYTTLGAKDVSKEQMDVYVDGKILRMDDYKKLTIYGAGMKGLETAISQKGQFEELQAFAESTKSGNGYPIPLWQMV